LERARLAELFEWIRVVGAVVWLILIVFKMQAGPTVWRQMLPFLPLYLVLALGLLLLGRHWPELRRYSNFAPALLDVPMILIVSYPAITSAQTRMGGDLLLGIYALVVLASVLSLERRAVAITAVTASVALCLLQLQTTGELANCAVSIFVLFAIALLTNHLVHRLLKFASRATRERMMRGHLGRYFSPAVVDKIVAGGGTGHPEYRDVTILFIDIRGFTAMLETLA